MSNESFVRYWHSPHMHDGTVHQVVEEADRLRVFVDTYDGPRVVVEFTGVREVKQHRPEEMLLYALAELRESPPFPQVCLRQFG